MGDMGVYRAKIALMQTKPAIPWLSLCWKSNKINANERCFTVIPAIAEY